MIPQPEKILLITERPLLSLNLRQLLEASGWNPGHMVLRPDQLPAVVEADGPALVVIDSDVDFPLERLTALCLQNPRSRFVVWCNHVSPPQVLAAMQSGVHGLLSVRLVMSEAARVLRSVWQGERQFRFDSNLQSGASSAPGLTPREQQVVSLVMEGRRNREIAEALHTTEGSVKVYMNRIFSKTGVKSRHELALTGHAVMRRQEIPIPSQTARPPAPDLFDAGWMFTGDRLDSRSTGVPYDSFKR